MRSAVPGGYHDTSSPPMLWPLATARAAYSPRPASPWRSHEAAVRTSGVASLDTWSLEAPR